MLDTKYNHELVEEGKYDKWLNKNYFKELSMYILAGKKKLEEADFQAL